MDDGSKPTVGSNYPITGATKSLCLKLDEFHLLVVNLPRAAEKRFSNIRSAANRIETICIANAAPAKEWKD